MLSMNGQATDHFDPPPAAGDQQEQQRPAEVRQSSQSPRPHEAGRVIQGLVRNGRSTALDEGHGRPDRSTAAEDGCDSTKTERKAGDLSEPSQSPAPTVAATPFNATFPAEDLESVAAGHLDSFLPSSSQGPSTSSHLSSSGRRKAGKKESVKSGLNGPKADSASSPQGSSSITQSSGPELGRSSTRFSLSTPGHATYGDSRRHAAPYVTVPQRVRPDPGPLPAPLSRPFHSDQPRGKAGAPSPTISSIVPSPRSKSFFPEDVEGHEKDEGGRGESEQERLNGPREERPGEAGASEPKSSNDGHEQKMRQDGAESVLDGQAIADQHRPELTLPRGSVRSQSCSRSGDGNAKGRESGESGGGSRDEGVDSSVFFDQPIPSAGAPLTPARAASLAQTLGERATEDGTGQHSKVPDRTVSVKQAPVRGLGTFGRALLSRIGDKNAESSRRPRRQSPPKPPIQDNAPRQINDVTLSTSHGVQTEGKAVGDIHRQLADFEAAALKEAEKSDRAEAESERHQQKHRDRLLMAKRLMEEERKKDAKREEEGGRKEERSRGQLSDGVLSNILQLHRSRDYSPTPLATPSSSTPISTPEETEAPPDQRPADARPDENGKVKHAEASYFPPQPAASSTAPVSKAPISSGQPSSTEARMDLRQRRGGEVDSSQHPSGTASLPASPKSSPTSSPNRPPLFRSSSFLDMSKAGASASKRAVSSATSAVAGATKSAALATASKAAQGAEAAAAVGAGLMKGPGSDKPSLSSLMATTGNLGAVATPTGVTVGPAPYRPGYKLARYSYTESPPIASSPHKLTHSSSIGQVDSQAAKLRKSSGAQGIERSRSTGELESGAREEDVSEGSGQCDEEKSADRAPPRETDASSMSSASLRKGNILWPKRFRSEQGTPEIEAGGGGRGGRGGGRGGDGWRSGSSTPGGDERARRTRRELFITMHIAEMLQRQEFIIRLARALMTYGAPTHRIEAQLAATARVLEIDAQFVYFPNCCLCSFGDSDTHTSSTHFIKQPAGGLDLSRLEDIHSIYRKVIHDEMHAAEGTQALKQIFFRRETYPNWFLVLLSAAISWFVCAFAFTGSFVECCLAAALGYGVIYVQFTLAARNPLFSNVFEISAAFVVSFVARGLAGTGLFCFESLVAGGVALILPGYIILCGALELASKSIVSGSVRMLYAIFFSLFLGFGIAIGSDLMGAIFPASYRTPAEHQAALSGPSDTITISGTFQPANASAPNPFGPSANGTFTFSNSTNPDLEQGQITCSRDPHWPWYRQNISPWFRLLIIPLFTLSLSLFNKQHWKSRHLPWSVLIACAGYGANYGVSTAIPNRIDITGASASFVVGFLGNLYSRFGRGSAFPAMVVGVLAMVPSGISAAGGLSMTHSSNAGSSFSSGLTIGLRMVEVALGITVGLFFASLLIYPIPKARGALFSF